MYLITYIYNLSLYSAISPRSRAAFVCELLVPPYTGQPGSRGTVVAAFSALATDDESDIDRAALA